jgi:renalase
MVMAAGADSPVVIVGAGVSGLACASTLHGSGTRVAVLERARGVGGRCATRRVEGQPVDFGVAFLHGRDREFLAALEAVPSAVLPGWPADIHGTGRPCQPEAFAPGERRLALAEGATAFPKNLARGLEIRLLTRVVGLEPGEGVVALRLEDGSAVEAPTAVLALAAEETLALLGAMAARPLALESARALLDMSQSQACLSLIAAYPAGTPAPTWQVSYPEDSRVLQLAIHDSSKRARPGFLAVVYQAHPHWSREHLEDPAWPQTLLAEAARLYGAWAAGPRLTQTHRWRHARNDLAAELAGPMLLDLPGGARLGLTGDRFAPGGGIEAAWSSGRRLAGRILAEKER